MMKPTDLREGHDLALIGWLYRARLWAILSEGEVGPGLVIIKQTPFKCFVPNLRSISCSYLQHTK
jgi:hypothetical protein